MGRQAAADLGEQSTRDEHPAGFGAVTSTEAFADTS